MALQSGNINGLFEAIKNQGVLEVADYQRNYAWTKDEITDLYNDIKTLVDPEDRHFMGSLILHKHSQGADVVDGQQRLTTVFILMSRLRDELSALGIRILSTEDPDGLDTDVMREIQDFLYPGKNTNTFRFVSNVLLREMFISGVISEPSKQVGLPKKHKSYSLALRKAHTVCRDLVRKDLAKLGTPEEKLEFIWFLTEAIKEKLQVLAIESTSLDESLAVFMTLNDRGLPLGAADLVRAKVLQNVSAGKPESEVIILHQSFLHDWQEVLDTLDTGNTDQFLRHYLLSITADKVRKKDIMRTVNDRLKGETPLLQSQNSFTFWEELKEAAVVYGEILRPDASTSYGYYLEVLRALADSNRVLLLNALSDKFSLSDNDKTEIVRLSLVITLRWFMAGQNAQDLETEFQDISSLLRETGNSDLPIRQLRQIAIGIPSVEKYFESSIDGVNSSKVILHGINRVLEGLANKLAWDPTSLHLEHIAPETKTAQWADALFGPGNSDEDYDEVVEKLGNKTLLDKGLNSKIKQESLINKQKEYVKATALITRDLVNVNQWDEAQIDSRGQWLFEMFSLIWVVTPDLKSVKSYPDWAASKGISI